MEKTRRVLSLFVCIMLVAGLAVASSAEKKESAGEYLDDSVITTKVKAEILNNPELKVLQIHVETYKGVVQLSGFVDSSKSAKRAAEIAAGVPGVKSVKNDLVVK